MMSTRSLVFARVLHVMGVVLWIGGVAFVTTVVIPMLRRLPSGEERLRLFEAIEGRFSIVLLTDKYPNYEALECQAVNSNGRIELCAIAG